MTKPSLDRATELWPIEKIHISRHARQRRELKDIPELTESLQRVGLINAIVVRENGTLVAGERRLTAAKAAGWANIRVTVLEKMPPLEADLIELQENIKRSDLPWQDEVSAIGKYHSKRMGLPAIWNELATANDVGMSERAVASRLEVNDAIRTDSILAPAILGCTSFSAAFNLLVQTRKRQQMAASSRAAVAVREALEENDEDDLLADTSFEKQYGHLPPLEQEIMRQVFEDDEQAVQSKQARIISEGKKALASLPQLQVRTAEEIIQQGDLLEWLPNYAGERFDVLHLDFPYGINYSGNRGRATGKSLYAPTYKDSPDLYWELVECLLSNKDRILLPCAHVFFWFDMRYYHDTIQAFTSAGFKLSAESPVIWNKENEGIASDPKRRYRHCYEAALLFSLGDRNVIKVVGDTATASSGKTEKIHISEKPISVLIKFLSALVDRHTAVADLTCGSGNALAAAHGLGAFSIRGWDIDPENVAVAQARIEETLNPAPPAAPQLPKSGPITLADLGDDL